jgi:DNA-binding transcriptional MocR family regulator
MSGLSLVFGSRIQIDPVGGGTQIAVRFQMEIAKERLLAIAAQCHLKMISLDEYYFDGRQTETYLIFFTNVASATIGEQLERFKELCDKEAGV